MFRSSDNNYWIFQHLAALIQATTIATTRNILNKATESNGTSVIVEALLCVIRLAVRDEIRGFVDDTCVIFKSADTPYLTVNEAAKLASLAPSTIRLYIRKGQLKALKVGRRVVVPRIELERFL